MLQLLALQLQAKEVQIRRSWKTKGQLTNLSIYIYIESMYHWISYSDNKDVVPSYKCYFYHIESMYHWVSGWDKKNVILRSSDPELKSWYLRSNISKKTYRKPVIDKYFFVVCRRCLRRQSARSKSQERGPTSDNYLFEIDYVNFGATTQQLDTPSPMHEEYGPKPLASSITIEPTRAKTQILRRSSNIGTPLRRAVEKKQSYKGVPAVNVSIREKRLNNNHSPRS